MLVKQDILGIIFFIVLPGAFQMSCSPERVAEPNSESAEKVSEIISKQPVQLQGVDSGNSKEFNFRIFKSSEVEKDIPGFGYEILSNGKVFIKQPMIPAIQGNKGFQSKEDAGKAAGLVIHKLKMGIMPPTISEMELDSLKIFFK